MFELASRLVGKVIVPHQCMHKVNDRDYLMGLVKDKYQNSADLMVGCLINVLNLNQNRPLQVHAIAVIEQGCACYILFDSIVYRPMKGDIVDFFITNIEAGKIYGELGPVSVVMPTNQVQLPELTETYIQEENFYIFYAKQNDFDIVFKQGAKIRAIVTDYYVHNHRSLTIEVKVDERLLQFLPTLQLSSPYSRFKNQKAQL